MTAPHSPDGGSRAIVSLRSASLGYGDHPIAAGVTLDIHAGEVVAILGPNGSGKSTLIKGLLGLNDHIGGEVEHFGTPIDRFRDHARVEYVPQRHTSSASVRATHRRDRGGRSASCRPAAGRCADDRAQRHSSAGCRQLPVGHANGRCARSCQQRGWGDSVVLCRHRSGWHHRPAGHCALPGRGVIQRTARSDHRQATQRGGAARTRAWPRLWPPRHRARTPCRLSSRRPPPCTA